MALIHYKGKRTQQELFEIATMHKEGAPAIDKLVSSSSQGSFAKNRVTKNINDIFAADPNDLTETNISLTEIPKRILIEGAPGIGKTVLAKEIAYQWAINEILTEIKIVFLLYLRDPQLQEIKSTKELVEYMSMGCLDDEQITTLNKYLVKSKGQQLCIVVDGFDEYPTSLQTNSFIVDIIKSLILPKAIVVITSRPTATVSLHDQVDRRIDILGLPKEERDKYISQVFNNLPEKELELAKYLKQQPVINGLCFVPLHLAILLYLFQQGSLPETLTKMNESFILHTIYRNLDKDGVAPAGLIDRLKNVPKPVLDIIYKLSKLAFKGLQEKKLVFAFNEIKQSCPYSNEIVRTTNGFGLLQAVEHYPHKGGVGKTTSFNFLHYTMQEFLAALHVSTLPSEQQSSLMNKTFWDGHYNFMWMMLVGIVGVKSDVFVDFISEGKLFERKSEVRIADTIRNDKRKCLHVFQCYLEAKENTEIPEVISSMFKDGKISFSDITLLPHDITSLMSFICIKQSTQWKSLELQQCKIGDTGMNVLQQFISDTTSTLEHVDLSDNNSSPWGVYCAIIRHCSVNSLTLCGGDGMGKYINELKEVFQTNTKLLSLKLCNINDDGAVIIAEAILMNTTIQTIDNSSNGISDNGAITISDSLKMNAQLQRLNISHNSITNVGIKKITEAIQVNPTLQDINISKNHISIEGLLHFMEAVKNNCTLQVVNITHNNVTRSGFTRIKQCIESLQHPIQIYASWNEILSVNGKLSVTSRLHSSTFQDSKDIENDVWSFEDYDHDHIVTCLSECLKEDDTLLELNMSKNKIFSGRESKMAEAIKVNITLQKLDVSFTSRHEYFVFECLKNNKSLKELNMSNTEITSEGAKVVAEAIKVNTTLQKLHLSFNKLSDDGASFISNGLKTNKSLQELNMSKNEITSEGAKRIAEALQVTITLKQLDLSVNKISDGGATAISNSLKNNIALQELNISHNIITNKGITKITKVVQINSKLQNINISKNHISTEGLLYSMEAVKINCTVQVVNITHNNVTRSGFTSIKQCIENLQHPFQITASWNEINKNGKLVTKISTSCAPDHIEEDVWSFEEYDPDHLVMCLSECLKEDNTLQELDLSYSRITSKGARLIVEAIKVNKTLKKLDIKVNSISDNGATAISDGLKSNNSLQELNMSSNHITSEGAKR